MVCAWYSSCAAVRYVLFVFRVYKFTTSYCWTDQLLVRAANRDLSIGKNREVVVNRRTFGSFGDEVTLGDHERTLCIYLAGQRRRTRAATCFSRKIVFSCNSIQLFLFLYCLVGYGGKRIEKSTVRVLESREFFVFSVQNR